MKNLFLTVCLVSLSSLAWAAPVQIKLNASSVVPATASDYFTLGSVASLTGGAPTMRARLASVPVGRAPLPGDVRELTPGDLDLKLREAGYEPGRDALVGGVPQANITVDSAPSGTATVQNSQTRLSQTSSPSSAAPSPIVVHPGDPVTIRIEDGAMSITAQGVAQSAGAVGDSVRVYREGCPTDFVATVLDSQDVSMEP